MAGPRARVHCPPNTFLQPVSHCQTHLSTPTLPLTFPSQLTKIDQMSLSAWHLSYSLEKRSLFGLKVSIVVFRGEIILVAVEAEMQRWNAGGGSYIRKPHPPASAYTDLPTSSTRAAPDLLPDSYHCPPSPKIRRMPILKGLFTIFSLSFKSHILDSNGVWYS